MEINHLKISKALAVQQGNKLFEREKQTNFFIQSLYAEFEKNRKAKKSTK